MFRCLREKYCGLTGGIATANNDHLAAPTGLRFDEGSAIVDARTFKAGQVLDWEFAVLSSSGDDHGARLQCRAALNFDDVWLALALESRRTVSDHYLCTELLCLRVRPAG